MVVRLLCAGLLGFVFVTPAASSDIHLEDDAGNTIRLASPAGRVVTLAPHLAEMMFEIGAGDALIGTVEWSNTPEAAKQVQRVGDGYRIDVERVVALEPDIVVAWGGGTPQTVIQQLEALGLPVAVLAPRDLDDIPRQLEWLGQLTANTSAASQKARDFRSRLVKLRDTFARRSTVSVFYQINDPNVFTVGGGHTISDLVEICGGKNIFSDLSQSAHAIDREAVITRNPDAIIIGSHSEAIYEAADWSAWPGMRAVKAGNIFTIDAELVARAVPRILDGGEQVCRSLEKARERLR